MPDEPTTDGQQTQSAAGDVEARIGSILAQRDRAQDQNTALQQQNRVLAERLARLEDTLSSQIRQPADAPGSRDRQDPSAGQRSAPASSQDIVELVRNAVTEAVKPINERFERSEAETRRLEKQKQAFGIAARQFPDLADPESVLSQTVERLWQGRPDLAQLDDAPVVFANIASGIVADQRRQTAQQTERKRDAQIPRPSDVVQRALNKGDTGDRAEAARQVKEKASEQGVVGSGAAPFADLFRANLQSALAEGNQD